MNGYFAAAVKLLDGDAFIAQYTENRIAEASVLDLISKTSFVHDPAFDSMGPEKRHAVKVEARLTNGETLTQVVEQRRGSAEFPLSRLEVERKFRTTAGTVLPPGTVDAVLANVWTIDRADSIRGL